MLDVLLFTLARQQLKPATVMVPTQVKRVVAVDLAQVRLKKEVLDESLRGNAKQRAPAGATPLNGDQWYVQQASRSAPTCITWPSLAL